MGKEPFSFANLSNVSYIETLYAEYLENPESVDPSWRYFFEGIEFGMSKGQSIQEASADLRVFHLIETYRTFGHLGAHFNPIDTTKKQEISELSLESHGFSEADLSKPFPTCGYLPQETVPLKMLIEALQKTYCNGVGFEYMGLQMPKLEKWIEERIEPSLEIPMTKEEKTSLLHLLNRSEALESFIHIKYPGQKRFSVEGGETLIPILYQIIESAGEQDVIECVLGMAHRGRLNVLTNILGKSYSMIFQEFEGSYVPESFEGSGDVKYHKGYSADLTTKTGKQIHVALSANPSHLESVDPVVEGMTRAKQEQKCQEGEYYKILPILIHGESAFSGQGVVYETMQFCRLEGYQTGGTIHIIINNQVGFTASPDEVKSTRYSSDLAKTFGAPVFHVNAENPESCVYIANLAVQIRKEFGCDVIIELNCYRKYGHNEGDEPGYTNPLQYELIRSKKNIRDLYRDALLAENTLSQSEAEAIEQDFKACLNQAFEAKATHEPATQPLENRKEDLYKPVDTAVPIETLKTLGTALATPPENIVVHPKLKRILDDRISMLDGNVDWGMGESLAYATLLTEGVHVRLSGQDSRRGTFSHRHAVIVDQKTNEKYIPLNHLTQDQAIMAVYNSHLSEYGVMGFEFGYSLAYRDALVLCEGQFGDFFNGAQIIIDQYIATSEQKWSVLSRLVLLMPHGYEGLGPEHSSARVERFLQLCGDDNMQVAIPSTPGQMFHLLRRQVKRDLRKPLLIFTPKALLRYGPSYTPIADFTQGTFQECLDDPTSPKNPTRLLICTGKVYYDLVNEREHQKREDIAIIRIEQLYPFHTEKLKALLDKYQNVKECFWVQEEHQNMGAWNYIQPLLRELLPDTVPFSYVGRRQSAAPAAGSMALHKQELAKFLEEAFRK